MKVEFNWISKNETIEGEICVSESDPEEIARFITRFEAEMKPQISLSEKFRNENNACYIFWLYYRDADYYSEFGSREDFIKNAEYHISHLIKKNDFHRDSNTTLMNAIVNELKTKGLYDRFQAIEEYYLPETYQVTLLTQTDFEFVFNISYGSEGTWLDCYLDGQFDQGAKRKIHIGTFKTLEDDMNAALVLGELSGAIFYVGNEYVKRNYERFSTPR